MHGRTLPIDEVRTWSLRSTSEMMSVAVAVPMALRRLRRISRALPSLQSCRMQRRQTACPSLTIGSVSAEVKG